MYICIYIYEAHLRQLCAQRFFERRQCTQLSINQSISLFIYLYLYLCTYLSTYLHIDMKGGAPRPALRVAVRLGSSMYPAIYQFI